MTKKLIITEKPSVARDFARVLNVNGRQNGYIENDEYVITWCVGHLVEMLYPEAYDIKYGKWKVEDLPFLPHTYKYGVISNVKQQYETVNSLLHRDDISTVYWAGDSGKEGQTIEENIRNFGGVREGIQELRVWIDSQTDEEIRRGIREAKPMSEYVNLGKSGIMRSIEDYALGINFSRALSVKYGKLLNDAAATESYTAIAVGRVMTCVLGMVVNREREIRNFVETPFYRVIGNFTEYKLPAEWRTYEKSKYYNSPLLYKENGFKEASDAEALIQELTGRKALVKSIDKNISRKKAPLLFNLAELQAECAKLYKISPDETLQVAQDLYESKLTTYPRTDARVLTKAVAREITKNLRGLKSYASVEKFVNEIMTKRLYTGLEKTAYVDDSKVTDHYAIIPTGQAADFNRLSEIQQKVYGLIVKRFLSIFFPPAEYLTIKLTIEINHERFYMSAKALQNKGYMEISGVPKSGDNEGIEETEEQKAQILQLADSIHENDEILLDSFEMKEGKTSPPKRYTSGTMILAMENAGNLIEDEELRAQIKNTGIGTSATRAEIIKKLVKIGYLNLNTKTQVLSPENLGEMIYEVVNMSIPSLLNPKMTASWEKGLEGITNGSIEMEDYREKLEEYIRTETIEMIHNDLTEKIAYQINQFTGKGAKGIATRKKLGILCPCCGGELTTTSFGFGCSNFFDKEKPCKFSIGTIAGRELTEEEFRELISNGKTKVLNGFISGGKKKFSAALQLNKSEEGKTEIKFDFSEVVPDVVPDIKCPVCGDEIEITPFGYSCKNHRLNPDKCFFSIGKIADRALSSSELRDLVLHGKTDVLSGFTSKKKVKFQAALQLTKEEDGKVGIAFDFTENQPMVLEGVKCPDCGGDILTKSFGYGCANFDKDNPDSCKFMIGKIADKDISVSLVKELLETGKTQTIRGFKSKNGTKFDACLVLAKDETGKHRVRFDFENVEAKIVKDVTCPICGGAIVKTTFGFACAHYKKDDPQSCNFTIGKIAGKELTEAQVKELLTNGKTSTIYGFKSKSNKRFDACITLDKNEDGVIKGIKFDFENIEAKAIKEISCPICGGVIVKTPFGFGCNNYKKDNPESCKFSIGKIAGKELTAAQVKELLTYGRTSTIYGFKSKSNKKFDACIALEKDENGVVTGIKFDFDNVEDKKIKDVKCPLCGGDICVNKFGYHCSNNKKEDENSCKFFIGSIAGVVLKEAQIKQLLQAGKTDVIQGFIAKTGMMFDASLKLEDGKAVFDFGEQTKPEETEIECPKCKKKLMRDDRSYSCECGYKLYYQVAKVGLSEEVIKELLTSGKTKQKISGFVSSNGNIFESYLRLDENKIVFDFERQESES